MKASGPRTGGGEKHKSNGKGKSALADETPTSQMVKAIERAYDHFNARLFNKELPALLLNLSRSKKGVMGFFAPEAWQGAAGSVCELSLTPACTSRTAEEVFSTLVHEMAHYLDHVRGLKPKSPGYHAKPWFETMKKIGLPPKPYGNSRVKVDHEIAPDGAFMKAFKELPPDVRLPFISIEAVFGADGKDAGGEDGEEDKETKMGKRARYECSGECGTTMRGPSGRTLICGDCEAPYIETGF